MGDLALQVFGENAIDDGAGRPGGVLVGHDAPEFGAGSVFDRDAERSIRAAEIEDPLCVGGYEPQRLCRCLVVVPREVAGF
ncbi:hypothetical protein A4G28_25120 [Mycobacterium ostraviense]|uniref:Uncharacterized protein n=1 Tax=Mycobacterium ostraviense TaxID=2738409 RepID=A0A164CZ53_9MYCO|nr:hypothetical protein A4G28_25120 [Mycobacterium ostraviense]